MLAKSRSNIELNGMYRELVFFFSVEIFYPANYIRPLLEGECLKFSRILKWVSTFGGAPLLGLSPVLQVMTIAAE